MYSNPEQFINQYPSEDNSNDRHSPNSSDGIGSSVSSSPSPTNSSRSASPIETNNIYSTPASTNYNYQIPLQNSTNYFFNHHQQNYTRYNSPNLSSNNENNYFNYHQYNNQYLAQQQFYYYNNNRALNSSNVFEDSTYYSRNNSINDQLNESCNNIKVATTVEVKKSQLKFSIDSILGTNKQDSPNKEKNQSQIIVKSESISNEDLQEECKSKPSKKRKARKQNESQLNSNKRIRTIFTQDQLDKLEVEFLRQQYMVGSERSYLATSLNLTESQVKIWFQNRRIKWRKTQSGADKSTLNGDNEFLNQSCSNESYADE